jgi:hypothetical protein
MSMYLIGRGAISEPFAPGAAQTYAPLQAESNPTTFRLQTSLNVIGISGNLSGGKQKSLVVETRLFQF